MNIRHWETKKKERRHKNTEYAQKIIKTQRKKYVKMDRLTVSETKSQRINNRSTDSIAKKRESKT